MFKKRRKNKMLSALIAMLLLFILVLEAVMERSPAVAEWVDGAIGGPGRRVLSVLSAAVPFSMTEMLLLLSPILLLLLIAWGIRTLGGERRNGRYFFALFCTLLVFFGGYVLLLSPGYRRPPVEERLGLCVAPPNEEELSACAAWLIGLAEEPAEIPGEEEVLAAMRSGFLAVGKRYGIRVFPMAAVKKTSTPLFLRLGFFGLYAFPFGEVTVAADCPMAVRTFTAAHEMAHASGYSREEEADIIGFLACLESGDPYLSYAAATGMLSRMLTALSESAPSVFEDTSHALPTPVRQELSEADRASGEVIRPTLAESHPSYDRTVLLLVGVFRARSLGGTAAP